MTDPVTIDVSALGRKRGPRNRPKGRGVDPRAAADIAALLGDAPRRRDLLIEFLHRIQDRYGHLSAAHLVALAAEMKLAMTEVYEVATFYHHFDVVKEGEDAPPALTVRVCETLSCQLAGGDALRRELASLRDRGVRVLGAPCIGRCEHAPAAVVGRNPVDRATAGAIAEAVAAGRTEPDLPPHVDLAAYRAGGGYRLLQRMHARRARGRRRHRGNGARRPARPGRRRLSHRPQVEDRARGTRAAADGGQHRRGRARHVQGPLLPRARSAPLPRGHADRRVGGRHRRDLRLPARRVRGVPRAARARAGRARRRSAVRAARHPPAPRRRRLHLRRRVRDDRVDRGQARHAAAAAAVRRAGRTLRTAHARAQHGDAVLAARDPRARRRVVRGPGAPRTQGAALVLRVGPRAQARRAPGARRHHGARADRRVLRRHAGRPRVLRVPSGRRVGRHPARVARRRPARLRHAAALRLLHRLGRRHRAVGPGPRARRGAQPDAVLRRRVLRPVHAVPRRHREGRRADGARRAGTSRCSPTCRRRWRTRRSAGSGQAAPNPIACVVKYFPHELE